MKDDGSLIKVSDMLEGDARKEGEDYEKYRIRRAAEKQLLRDYLGGLMIPNEWDFTNPEQPRPISKARMFLFSFNFFCNMHDDEGKA